MSFSISFSLYSCFSFCSTTRPFRCLYLVLYFHNSSNALISYSSILTSTSSYESSPCSIYSILLGSSIPRKRTSSSSLSLYFDELLFLLLSKKKNSLCKTLFCSWVFPSSYIVYFCLLHFQGPPWDRETWLQNGQPCHN
jgi:hypothetical protein